MARMLDKMRALRSLRKTPSTLKMLLQGVDQARAVSATDGPDGWSVLVIMCHLRDFERIFRHRIDQMLEQDNPTFELVDHLDLVTKNSYATQTIEAAFAEYMAARRDLVALLVSLPDEAWSRPGLTGAGLETSVLDMAYSTVTHDIDHTEQIGRALGLMDTVDF
jgi:hypothetical protein